MFFPLLVNRGWSLRIIMDTINTQVQSVYSQADNAIEQILVVIVSMVYPDVVTAKTIVAIMWRMKAIIIFIAIAMLFIICGLISAVFFPNYAQISSEFLSETPAALVGYLETGFMNSASPYLSPLGPVDNIYITAFFNDANYYKYYHRWHKAIDIVPSNSYYQQNQAFKLTSEVIIFATCSGSARSLQDAAGANYIYLICNDKRHAVLMVHNARNFLPLGDEAPVIAGQPLAVMGNTGNSYGAHIHYAIKDLITGELINPLPSLQIGN